MESHHKSADEDVKSIHVGGTLDWGVAKRWNDTGFQTGVVASFRSYPVSSISAMIKFPFFFDSAAFGFI